MRPRDLRRELKASRFALQHADKLHGPYPKTPSHSCQPPESSLRMPSVYHCELIGFESVHHLTQRIDLKRDGHQDLDRAIGVQGIVG